VLFVSQPLGLREGKHTFVETSLTAANDLAIGRALEGAGIEFIDENGGGAGVRLRKPGKEKSRKLKGLTRRL